MLVEQKRFEDENFTSGRLPTYPMSLYHGAEWYGLVHVSYCRSRVISQGLDQTQFLAV